MLLMRTNLPPTSQGHKAHKKSPDLLDLIGAKGSQRCCYFELQPGDYKRKKHFPFPQHFFAKHTQIRLKTNFNAQNVILLLQVSKTPPIFARAQS